MHVTSNPFIEKLINCPSDTMPIGQVILRRVEDGFELRHAQDAPSESGILKELSVMELRALSQHTEDGRFRPLKSAPDLRAGWICRAANAAELAQALEELYPGALADWFAVETATAQPTSLRDFTARQTGMYRISQTLTDTRAMEVVRAGCDSRFCLKRRLWHAPGLAADREEHKSCMPCLEPCAMLLEFARVAGRMDREEALTATLAPAEVESLLAALKASLTTTTPEMRQADFSAPANPRRLLLLHQKLSAMLPVREDAPGHG